MFEKVGECLYRYVPTGTYYARIKLLGKEVRRSLDTTDRTDVGAARMTLANLCDRYLATVKNQSGKTLKRKDHIVARIKADFPGVLT